MIEPDINERMARFAPSQNLFDPAQMNTEQRQYLDSLKAAGDTDLKSTMMAARQVNPDQAAKAQALGSQVGVGADIAMRNMSEVEQRAYMQRLAQLNLSQNDPVLARFLSSKSNAMVAHDDLDTLRETKGLFGDAVGGFRSGEVQTAQSYEAYNLMMAGVQPGSYEWNEAKKRAELSQRLMDETGQGFVASGAQIVGAEWKPFIEAQRVGAAASVAAGMYASAAEFAGPTPVVAGIGYTAGVVGSLATSSYKRMAGNIYFQMREEGIEEDSARTIAHIAGAINASIEFVGMIPVVGQAKSAVMRMVTGEVVEQLTKQGLLKVATTAVKESGTTIGVNILEENAQEFVDAVAMGAGQYFSGKQVDLFTTEGWRKQMQAHVETTIQTFKAMTLLSMPLPILNAGLRMRGLNKSKQDVARLEKAMNLMAQSRLRKRDPAAAQALIDARTEGVPGTKLYIEAAEVAEVLKQANVDPRALDGLVPGFSRRLGEALASNGDLVMTQGEFLAQLADQDVGKAMLKHVRVGDPEAKSAVQIKQIEQEALRMVEDLRKNAGQFANQTKEYIEQVNAIEDDIIAMAELTGKFTPEQVRTNAALQLSFVVTQAKEMNWEPRVFWAMFRNQIIGPDAVRAEQEQQALAQQQVATLSAEHMAAVERGDMEAARGITEQAARVAGFTSPRLYKAMPSTDVEGRPITTIQRPSEFPAFNRGEPGVRIAGFFAEDRPVAERFTAMTMPAAPIYEVYLREDNPYVIDAAGRTAGDVQFGPSGAEFRDAVRSGKYDSIIIRNTVDEGTIHVALDPSKIKSADPVTYDEQGNVIPLSRRFDVTSPRLFEQQALSQQQIDTLDAQHAAAEQARDVATGERLTKQAAMAAGLTETVYRGDQQPGITEYAPELRTEPGIFTTYTRNVAEEFYAGEEGARKFYVGGRTLDLSWESREAVEWIREWARESGFDFIDRASGEAVDPVDAVMSGRMFDFEGDWSGARWKDIQRTAKAQGYDIVKLKDSGDDIITSVVVLNENNIKLADPFTYDAQGNLIPLSRRFNLQSRSVLEQQPVSPSEPRLMAVHNLSEENLQFAAQMGGLAVPSMGVVTAERGGVEGFGEITLIGTQDMVDPASSRAFEADAYTARFPRPEYAKVPAAKADRFLRSIEGVAAEFGDDALVAETFESMVNSTDPQRIIDYWARSPAIIAMFLRSKGIEVAPVMQKRDPSQIAWSETRDAMQERVEPFVAEFKSWVDAKVMARFGRPFLRVGKRKVPYTLNNIVEAMTGKVVRGKEKGMTFGYGRARAAKATEFKTLEQMRKAAKRAIVDPRAYKKAADRSEKVLDAFRNSAVKYTTIMNWQGRPDTWEALDSSMRAIAAYGPREKRNADAMRRALRKERFDVSSMPPELIEQAMDAADALYRAPVPYFEAKPQRAVALNEFAGAVIPDNASAETRATLESAGVPMMEYPRGDDDARLAAVREMAIAQSERRTTVFQQPMEPSEPQGTFDVNKFITTVNASANISTLAHEGAHWWLEVMGRLAARPDASERTKSDFDKILQWFGIDGATAQERLARWNSMSLAEKEQHHEAFARNWEILLYEGKAPSAELQSVFEKFSRWMKQLYISIRDQFNAQHKAKFGVDLPMMSQEIREVMERVIASDEQIARQKAIRSAMGLFETKPDDMTDAEWEAYQQMQQEADAESVAELRAQSLKAMKWLRRAERGVLRDMQEETNQRRSEMREKVAEEVPLQRVYRAREFLSRGRFVDATGTEEVAEGHRLDIDAVRQMYELEPENLRPDLSKLGTGAYGMMGKGGMNPEVAAEMFGYVSADEMIRDLIQAPPVDEAIEAETDRRMLAEYGDMNTKEQREAAVDSALHNELRSRMNAVELRFLSKATQPVRVMVDAARRVARNIIGQRRLRDIRPREYIAAESRAARDAQEAYRNLPNPETVGKAAYTRSMNEQASAIAAGMAVSDAEAIAQQAQQEATQQAKERIAEYKKKYPSDDPAAIAVAAKRQQLLNHELAREALAARDEVDKAIGKFRRMFKADADIARTRNMDKVMAARAILAAFGLGRSDKPVSAYMEQIRKYDPDMAAELEPIIAAATAGAVDYRDMTLDQFRAMRDAVEALWFNAKRDQEIVIEGQSVRLEAALGELSARLEEMGVPEVVPGERMAPTAAQVAAREIVGLKAHMRTTESWAEAMDAQRPGGPFTKYIWNPIKAAINAYRADRNKYIKRLVEIISGIDLPVQKIHSNELGYTFGTGNGGMGKAEVLGAMMHMGNESNLRKLLLGRRWGELDADGNLDTSRWDAFVQRMFAEGIITKADMDALQQIWDLNEELKPLAQKAHRQIFGYYFKEVEASPVQTPFGTYRGGYVPAKTDPFMVQEARQQAMMEDLETDFRQSMPSTGFGFTKGRVEYNRPLSLDLRLMTSHIDGVLRFAHIQPSIKDVLKLLKNRAFAEILTRVDPTVIEDMLIPWLNRAARQVTSEAGRHPRIDRFWRGVRSRTGIAIMMGNLSNIMQQVTGLMVARVKVKGRYMRGALMDYMKSPFATADMVANMSPFMMERMRGQVFQLQSDLNDLLLNPSKFAKMKDWAAKHGYFGQQAAQNVVDIIAWVGAYNQTLAEVGGTMTREKAHTEAVRRADAVVRLTQSSLLPEDMSRYQVGTPFYQTFVQFTSYFNMLANLNLTEYTVIFRDLGWKGNKGRLFATYLFGFAMPMIVADAIAKTMRGQWDDEDDDGYFDEFMDVFFGSQLRGATAMIPFGSAAYTAFAGGFTDKTYDDRITSSPSVAALEASTVGVAKTILAAVDPDRDVSGKNVRDTLTLVSLVTGLPLQPLARPFLYAMEVERGNIEPTDMADYIRGLITGTASEASKNR